MTKTLPSPAAVLDIPLANIRPNPRNPRRTGLDAESVASLAASIDADGLNNPVIVRVVEETPLAGTFYELISGHRRVLAFRRLKRESIPARVQVADDNTALVRMLVEFLQQQPPSHMEEALGFREALALRTPDGKPVFTAEDIAARVGKGAHYVLRRAMLCELPEEGQTAVLEGLLPVSQAELIARLPEAAARAAALAHVLNIARSGHPMTNAAVELMIETDYMRDLRAAPFDRSSAILWPEAGACTICPHRTGANPERFGVCERGRAQLCTKPGCYREKVARARARLAEKLAAEGKTVLPAEESELEYPATGSGLRFNSPFVELDAPVARELLKREVLSVPTWRELVDAAPAKPKIVVAFDQKGTVRELVNRELAMAGIDAADKHLFRATDREKARITPEMVAAPTARKTEGGPSTGSGQAVDGQEDDDDDQESKAEPVTAQRVEAVQQELEAALEMLVQAHTDWPKPPKGWLVSVEALLARHGLLEDADEEEGA